MVYVEITSGGVRIGGCVLEAALSPINSSFAVGDIVYNADKARRGILERVVIKSVRSIESRQAPAVRVLYTDTFNGLWNEWDLVIYNDAIALADAYRAHLVPATPPAPQNNTINFSAAFAVGDVFYVADKARRGILEVVVIKAVRGTRLGQAMYTDTLNALWNESDLVNYDQAAAFVVEHEQMVAKAMQALPSC